MDSDWLSVGDVRTRLTPDRSGNTIDWNPFSWAISAKPNISDNTFGLNVVFCLGILLLISHPQNVQLFHHLA